MAVIQEIHPNDGMYQGNKEHYFHVGESARECIMAGIGLTGKTIDNIKSVLDLPCGYGRVLRHLKDAFPNARLTACDLETEAVDFCAKIFGAHPVYSNKETSKLRFDSKFDLVWVGSLFTHINLNEWYEFLNLFSKSLNPGGLLFISLHGPFAAQRIKDKKFTYGLNKEQLDSLMLQYNRNHFGYENYSLTEDYGISISSPEKTLDLIKNFPELSIISYTEKGWDNHHDILCCQRTQSNKTMNIQNQNTHDLSTTSGQSTKLSPEITGKSNVVFILPEGLTLGGVTSWSVELSRELRLAGFTTALGIHPSRYNNPAVDFVITENDRIIDCMHLPHPDDPALNAEEYLPYYETALPGTLVTNWSWGAWEMAARFASRQPDSLRVIGMGHSDESGYYQWLAHYEAMIHKFIVMNGEIRRKLIYLIPYRAADILVKPCPAIVPTELKRTWSPIGKPLQIVYAGRIAQYQKRVFDFIDLVEALVKRGVNFNFRVIGGGADEDEFFEKVNQLPQTARKHMELVGAVPPSEMPGIWHSADINLIVSDFEGVSNAMLNGMAAGCVPVMTRVSGTTEVITPGKDGLLVPVGDMEGMAALIEQLDHERSQLAILGMNAFERVKRSYSMDEYVGWFADVVHAAWAMPARPWPPVNKPMAFDAIHQKIVQINENLDRKPASDPDDKKNKVLFSSHDYNWGGAPKVLYSLIKGLDKDKWVPIVAMPKPGELEKKFEALDVKTIITPMELVTINAKIYWQQYERFSSNLRERVYKVVDLIQQEGIDLVVSNTICMFESALAAKLTGIPHIWYIHELSSKDDQLTPIFDFPTFYAMLDALSDKLVVISKVVQDEIAQFFPSKKFELIYTGLEYHSPPTMVEKRETLDVLDKTPVVTYLGVISQRKGLLGLVDLARIVAKRIPDVKFVIAGKKEGTTFTKLQDRIIEEQLESRFKFLGFRDNIQDVIACSDMIIIPSLVEPFSLVALEALLAGKPVVATRSGGPEEIIQDGETGLLVPVNSPYEMAQAIIRLLENPELAKSIGEMGRKHVLKNFNYEAYIARFDKLLEETSLHTRSRTAEDTRMVDQIINLATVAAKASARIGELNQSAPKKVVEELLDYPGYVPYEIPRFESQEPRPKVSICIPVYNGEAHLRECIDSILSQTLTDFELVIANDASTDGSMGIAQSYKDPRIKLFENERNLGLVGNWNRCLELSRGEYVCLFHQDDIMLSDNIEKKASLLDNSPQTGLVYSDTLVIDLKGNRTADHWFNMLEPNLDFVRPGRSFFDLMFENLNVMSCPSVLVRRECYEKLGGFDMRLPFSVDMEMWMRIALFYDVAYLSQPLIKYRFHDRNLTHSFLDLDLIHVYLCKRMVLEKYPKQFDKSHYEALIQDTSHRVFERAIHHYHMMQYKTAKQYLHFLERIRTIAEAPELIDIYIRQLQTYVNQAHAIDWIRWGERAG